MTAFSRTRCDEELTSSARETRPCFSGLVQLVDNPTDRREVIRPCYYILPVLGMWNTENTRFNINWRIYRAFIYFVWLAVLVAVMCLDFVHYGFNSKSVHVRAVMNSVCTSVDFLCPFVFTLYYFNHGQFVDVVSSVQNVSDEWYEKLRKMSRWYTLLSLILWALCAAFFMVHWYPFFSKPWHYGVYIPVIIVMSGWWAAWLTIYGYVCHVHSLQIDIVSAKVASRQQNSTAIFLEHIQLQNSLEKTQKDFSVIISLAIIYHSVDLIVFSFAYFNSAFGNDYPLWQYVGTVLFDLLSLIFKLYPPALVAAAVHRLVLQGAKRCHTFVTPTSTELPLQEMQLFQYMASCEADMGLKILGIRITLELALQLLMAIVTIAVSFVAFVIPKLK